MFKYNVGMEKLKRLAMRFNGPQRLVVIQTMIILLCVFAIFTASAGAVVRFTNRSLFIYDPTPGATTKYTISFTYNNAGVSNPSIGSVDLIFCYDPIPSDVVSLNNPIDLHQCVKPAGLDVSHAVLATQSGETGYSILSQTSNEIVLTRPPSDANEIASSYTFTGVVNSTDTSKSYAVRMADYNSTDASGQYVNLGSALTQVGNGPILETQVAPTLIFCVAQQVAQDCSSTSGGNFTDLGTLDATQPLLATSQMAVGTNASGGFAVTANGPTMEAGTNIINSLATPTVSAPGNSQFGINLVANTSPNVGSDPDGAFTNAIVAPGYDTPNEFKYVDGDLIATAPNVSLVRRYTVSYIVNVPPNLRAGVYTTTITYICSGRF